MMLMKIKLLSEYFRKCAPIERDITINFKPLKKVILNKKTFYKQETKLIECVNCSIYGALCWRRAEELTPCGEEERHTIWISGEDLVIRRKRYIKEISIKKIQQWKKERF